MEDNEKVEELEKEMEESSEVEETGISIVQGFGMMHRKSKTKAEIFTNITDNKKIFNLDTHVDNLLNECEGELIRVKEVLIKRYEKPLKEPVIDEETGEILKDKEYSMACILIDANELKEIAPLFNDKSYATGSKMFTIQMQRYIDMFGINENGFEIKIVKIKQQSGNKALGFELV